MGCENVRNPCNARLQRTIQSLFCGVHCNAALAVNDATMPAILQVCQVWPQYTHRFQTVVANASEKVQLTHIPEWVVNQDELAQQDEEVGSCVCLLAYFPVNLLPCTPVTPVCTCAEG